MQHLGAERGLFQHLFIGDAIKFPGTGDDARVGGINTIDVGIDVTRRIKGRGNRHGRGIGTTTAERGDAAVRADALEAGDHRHLALFHALADLVAVDLGNAGSTMNTIGLQGDLPTGPGAGGNADILQHDGQQSRRHLFARCDNGIIFAGVMDGRRLAAPAGQTVGGAGHGRNHDRHMVASLHFTRDMLGDIADVDDIRNRGAAEFHNQTAHRPNLSYPRRPTRNWCGRWSSLMDG